MYNSTVPRTARTAAPRYNAVVNPPDDEDHAASPSWPRDNRTCLRISTTNNGDQSTANTRAGARTNEAD